MLGAGSLEQFYYNLFPLIWHALRPSDAIGPKRFSTSDLCPPLDGVVLVSLGICYARTVWFPTDPKLQTPKNYVNFDLPYQNGTKANSKIASL